jgi:hypothetical protein
MLRNLVALGIGVAAAGIAGSVFAEPPNLVAAYTQQLVRQCGGTFTAALATQVVRQIDLNGDKLDDWVVDASRYPCPTRPAVFASQGFQVTIFAGRLDGRALPAFQRTAYGSRIEGKPETGYALWLTLGGSDCSGGAQEIASGERLARRDLPFAGQAHVVEKVEVAG